MKTGQEITDIARHTARTERLSDTECLAVALELINYSGTPVRPEVTSYLREALREALTTHD